MRGSPYQSVSETPILAMTWQVCGSSLVCCAQLPIRQNARGTKKLICFFCNGVQYWPCFLFHMRKELFIFFSVSAVRMHLTDVISDQHLPCEHSNFEEKNHGASAFRPSPLSQNKRQIQIEWAQRDFPPLAKSKTKNRLGKISSSFEDTMSAKKGNNVRATKIRHVALKNFTKVADNLRRRLR